jgi:hypothetical protein
MAEKRRLELADEPGRWTITMFDGTRLHVTADGYEKKGDLYVFSIVMKGVPNFEIDIAKIPVAIVSKIRGGPVV